MSNRTKAVKNIKDLKKLNELKEQGILTEQEFEEQKRMYLDSLHHSSSNSDKDTTSKQEKNQMNLSKKLILCFGGFLVFCFIVNTIFPYTITCKENITGEACKCIQSTYAKNIPFTDKVRFFLLGASEGELAGYVNGLEVLGCLALSEE